MWQNFEPQLGRRKLTIKNENLSNFSVKKGTLPLRWVSPQITTKTWGRLTWWLVQKKYFIKSLTQANVKEVGGGTKNTIIKGEFLFDELPQFLKLSHSFFATSTKFIEQHFLKNKSALLLHAIMAQPLTKYSYTFCLCLFGTDNKLFTHDVRNRWIPWKINKLYELHSGSFPFRRKTQRTFFILFSCHDHGVFYTFHRSY